MGWPASRPAPRARTSCSAPICRRAPIRRTGIRDAGFREAVARYLEHEWDEVDLEIDWLEAHAPFRKPQAEAAAKSFE